MTHSSRRWRPRRAAVPAALLAGALVLAAATSGYAAPDPEPPPAASAGASVVAATEQAGEGSAAPYSSGIYLVRLADEPLASYSGGVPGLKATAPSADAKLDTRSAASRAYRAHLSKRRTAALASLPDVKLLHTYDTAFNGFAAKLTGRQAAELAATRGVVSIEPNTMLEADTVTTPAFLGLSGRHGVWQKYFKGDERAGEGVIVGVIDSSYVPENKLFAPLPEPRPDAALIAKKWKGTCDHGAEAPVECNNKVIGARYYHAGNEPVDAEYLSPRDFHGHGTHTASTAAGNHGVTATVDGRDVGTLSGMAPAARLAVYKTCWRELHDMVAHSIGIIAIQAGVGSRVIQTQPAEAQEALRAIEATSRETLSGLRRTLVALRQAAPLPFSWPRNGAPGPRARYGCLPPVEGMTWGVLPPGLGAPLDR